VGSETATRTARNSLAKPVSAENNVEVRAADSAQAAESAERLVAGREPHRTRYAWSIWKKAPALFRELGAQSSSESNCLQQNYPRNRTGKFFGTGNFSGTAAMRGLGRRRMNLC
jgi:hypothetical protein